MNYAKPSIPIARAVAFSILVAGYCLSGSSAMFLGHATADETNAAAQVAKERPLSGLPTKEANHIARIKAMSDDAWLNLGAPQADPKWGRARGRGYTPKMAYAPDLRGAFLYGEGVHGWWNKETGKYMDGLWVYDINGHRWVCVYPGTDVDGPIIKTNDQGVEVDRSGEPIPVAPMVHGYEMITYNTHLRKFMFLPCPGAYWRNSVGKRRQAALDGSRDPSAPRTSPRFYDVASGKWEHRLAKAPGDMKPDFCGSLIYLPTTKQTLFYKRKDTLWLYDHAANRWTSKTPQGPQPSTADYEGLSCYDSKRSRIYICNDKEETIPIVYDVKIGKWQAPRPATQPLDAKTRVLRSASGVMSYDMHSDKLVFFQFRTKGEDRAGYFVYDPEANTWTTKPRLFPKEFLSRGNGKNSFYDPVLNVHYFHAAGDSRDNGVIWAYRYKR